MKKGFTLIEMLIVVSIIGILIAMGTVYYSGAQTKAKVVQAASIQRQFKIALEEYKSYMGFYPPDVNRGTDPGFTKPLPYNPDTGLDCNVNPGDCPVCPHCPSDWITRVQARWIDPFMTSWPRTTPWGGKYDYNYWASGATRFGCSIPAGVYIGVQGDYSENNKIPQDAEQTMLNQKFDSDGCLNGESQVLYFSL